MDEFIEKFEYLSGSGTLGGERGGCGGAEREADYCARDVRVCRRVGPSGRRRWFSGGRSWRLRRRSGRVGWSNWGRDMWYVLKGGDVGRILSVFWVIHMKSRALGEVEECEYISREYLRAIR